MFKRWLKHIGIAAIAFVTTLVIAGGLYQLIYEKLDAKNYPPPGTLIDIGGYKMHILGMGKSGPSVILDAGMSCNSLDWSLAQPEIAKFAKVYSFDRAGNGWSDKSPLPRTSLHMVEELHALLKKSQIPPPYIFVGHSFGGANVLLYANKYPDEVAGIVLVDSCHEDQLKKMPPDPPPTLVQRMMKNSSAVSFLASIGAMRFFNQYPQMRKLLETFPEDIQEMYTAQLSTVKYNQTLFEETANLEESFAQVKAAGEFINDKPLIVITAGRPFDGDIIGYSPEFVITFMTAWRGLQKDLVKKSSKGKQIFAEDSDHLIPRHQPQIIVEAVKQIIEEIQS